MPVATRVTAVRIAARRGEVISQSGTGQDLDFSLGEGSRASAEAARLSHPELPPGHH